MYDFSRKPGEGLKYWRRTDLLSTTISKAEGGLLRRWALPSCARKYRMPKAIGTWDEDDILALPRGENDAFERKGSRLLDLTVAGVSQDDVLNELGKQLSAFANTGGGRIFYGLADNGTVDSGGVTRLIRGRQTAKDWLET